MSVKRAHPNVDRRKFLAGVALAGTAAVSTSNTADAAVNSQTPVASERRAVLPPSAQVAANEAAPVPALSPTPTPGSDYMVDVIKQLDIDYVFCNPSSALRGIHESFLTYGGNRKPEFITCTHEEISVAMAHGYFKVAGKPQMALCHGTVGLQHATMAIYNAWCDRVPVIVVGGNSFDASKRPPGVPTIHSAQDINALVRDFTKWDDSPASLTHFGQSMMRAYRIAMTPPYGPVMMALDAELQEAPIEGRKRPQIPKLTRASAPQADLNAIREAAKLLAEANNPVIVVDRVARTENGVKLLIELAEALQAAVVNVGGRMNFPNTHYLNQTNRGRASIRQADVILGMELTDFWGTVNAWIDNAADHGAGEQERIARADAKLISISSVDLLTKSNYQDFQRYQPIDVAMPADAEASLPSLIAAVKSMLPANRRSDLDRRAQMLRAAWEQARRGAKAAAAVGWDASPISTARMCAELWAVIKNEDWTLASSDYFKSLWPSRLWKMERHHHYLGISGGYGEGYGAAAPAGAALANKTFNRVTVSLVGDGDLMYAPGILWTLAHHRIPLLNVVHNNRAYHQEIMHVQRTANRRDRVLKDGPIGTTITNPNIDFAALAKSQGVWAIGPVESPNDLGPALKKAVEVVKAGEPALVDVVSQPR